ncbi:type II secretion system F family protein [Acidithiobacillus sp.]
MTIMLLPAYLIWLASFSAALVTVLLVVSGWMLLRQVPVENRDYLDPLPPLMRVLWPLVRLTAHMITGRLPTRWLERVHTLLLHSSASYLMLAEDFVALQMVSGLLGGLAALFCAMALGFSPILPGLLGLLAALLPLLWLRERRQRRDRAVLRMLPIYLDYITLAVEAGLNFAGALDQAINNGPEGILRQEFALVLRDIKAGLTRAQSLRRLHERVHIAEIGAFVAAINQAERTGGSLGRVLRAQAGRSRTERFQRAEKAAMEAPVKLLGPLVLFIFPTTFLVIAFPIVELFLHSA